jgi:hypothetical protein
MINNYKTSNKPEEFTWVPEESSFSKFVLDFTTQVKDDVISKYEIYDKVVEIMSRNAGYKSGGSDVKCSQYAPYILNNLTRCITGPKVDGKFDVSKSELYKHMIKFRENTGTENTPNRNWFNDAALNRQFLNLSKKKHPFVNCNKSVDSRKNSFDINDNFQ